MLVILGPTCVGKTQVSLKLADILKGEIISFDSRQIYQFMDIGTAKPTKEEREKIHHHLIDVIPPDQKFSAADYSKKAREIITQIFEKGKQPIAVGGSGLYLKALIKGFFQGPPADQGIRERLKREAQTSGEISLFDRLKKIDPQAAERIHPHDLVRIVRALEIYELTGKPITDCQQEGQYEPYPTSFIKIGLSLDMRVLYERINQRVEEMVEQGLLEEVKNLKEIWDVLELKAFKTVGYREMILYLNGDLDFKGAIEKIKTNTRHYAKRQMTWFRKDKEITWLDATDKNLIGKILDLLYRN
ncbi:MAG: tRNA (adenosine(37)-N6)-dimethylallyltransferase MiaA [Candidatus Zixiibacteriota bacterium]